MPKFPVTPKTQALSDALMMLRYAQLEVKECAAKTQNALIEAKNEAMDIHARISEWARAHGFDLPAAPAYSQEYLDLAGSSVALKLSNHPRR